MNANQLRNLGQGAIKGAMKNSFDRAIERAKEELRQLGDNQPTSSIQQASLQEWQTEAFNRADDAMRGSVPPGRQMSPEYAKLLAYTLPPPLPFELPAVALDHAQLARQVSLEHEEHTRNLSELSKVTGQVTDSNRVMFDTIHELDGGVGALGGTMDLATFGMDGMSAAMVTGTQEAFTYTGQMGTLEDQALSTLDAFKLLAGAPPLPTGVGGPAGAWGPPPGVSAHTDPTELDPVQAEKQRILNMPPPANLEDLFLSQRELGHNISLYADAEAWWEAHKRELASNVPGYAGGTPYAPGGLALVGEIGPELVHLPRGSQVIPNPQLDNGVTVNVTVQGSVVAERDLAQRIRQELIRTSRRTVDLGFVS